MDYKVITGDSLQVLKTLPGESIQCCVTSPPYWGLRDYGTAKWEGGSDECDHTYQKGGRNPETSSVQLGNKGTTFSQYEHICKKCGATRVDKQLGLESTPEEYVSKMVEIFREVRRVLRKDGTLWLNLGDSYAGNCSQSSNNGRAGFGNIRETLINRKGQNIKPKDLVGIPWRVAFALQADGWYLRQDIIWAKPNPMPESVTDRCTKAHEYIFLMTKSGKYYYDNEAVKEPVADVSLKRVEYGWHSRGINDNNNYTGLKHTDKMGERFCNPDGRNKRSVWTVATKPYKDAHFATFPPDLIEPCILAGSKSGDVILDPFAGSGTTLAVATKHNRNSIGIELNPEYVKLIHKRVLAVPLSIDFDEL